MAPTRTCVVCRQRRADTEMVRAGRVSGTWFLGRGDGRGVWWCRDGACEQDLRVGHLARALRTAVHEGDVSTLRALAASKRL